MAVKLYMNKGWLHHQLNILKKPVEQVAKEQGVSHMTIRRAAGKLGVSLVKW